MLTFTNIQHEFRKQKELSLMEYCLCDMIFYLSTTNSKVPNWCYAKRETLAKELGISKSGINKMISRMEQRGFLKRDEDTRFIQVTQIWKQVYTQSEGIPQETSGSKRDEGGSAGVAGGSKRASKVAPKESSYNNTVNNNTNNNKDKGDPLFNSKAKFGKVVYPFDTTTFIKHWDVWKQFKKQQFNFTYKGNISEQAALRELSTLANADERTATKIIVQSIKNGWKGFFQLKQNTNEGRNTEKQQNAINDWARVNDPNYQNY